MAATSGTRPAPSARLTGAAPTSRRATAIGTSRAVTTACRGAARTATTAAVSAVSRTRPKAGTTRCPTARASPAKGTPQGCSPGGSASPPCGPSPASRRCGHSIPAAAAATTAPASAPFRPQKSTRLGGVRPQLLPHRLQVLPQLSVALVLLLFLSPDLPPLQRQPVP